MSKHSLGPRTKGLITITVRDAETLEVKRVQEETNTFTIRGISHNLFGWYISGVGLSGSNNTEYDRIYTSERRVAEFPAQYLPGIETLGTDRDKQDIVVQAPTYFDGSPPYMEIVARFNPPTVPRSIETIYWGYRDTDSAAAIAYASLATPCPHGITEVLDITYRIQFFYDDPAPGSTGSGLEFGNDIRRAWTDNNFRGWPQVGHRIWTGKFPQNSLYNYLAPVDVQATTRGTDLEHRKWTYTFSKVESGDVGKLFGGMGYGVPATNYGAGNQGRLGAWGPIAGPSFPNKPIQPVHNHSFDAIEPFLDVDFLAGSSGSLTIDGSAWTDPDWPKFYRVEYTATGLVGASKYYWRVRDTMGFSGSSYQSAINENLFKHRISTDDEFTGTLKTIPNGHGLRDIDLEEYNNTTKISWNDQGITILNDVNGEYVNFDSTTTPAIGFVTVGQVAVDDNKDIWVSDRSGGLYKITDPLGSPTVTHFDNATHGIPVGGESACYGVAVGFGNTVWAMFNGGLSKTTDGGTSWVNHDSGSVPAFDYTGITDGNWGNVYGIRIDRESPNFEMAILGTEGTGAADLVWWDPVTATAVLGPSYASSNRLYYCRCSRHGGLWQIRSQTEAARYRTKYGTTEKLSVMQPGRPFDGLNGAVCFLYDSYGTPHMFGGGTEHSDIGGVHTLEGKRIDNISFTAWYQNDFTPYFTFEENYGNGLTYFNNIDPERPERMAIVDPRNRDPLNWEHSPFEEFIWREYRWNGAAWVRNWHAPAVDSSGNGNDGDRKNFDIENHTFTGRSLIDGSAIFNPSAFTTDATFAFLLSPTTKPSALGYTVAKQEPEIVVFEVNDAAGANRLKFWWDDTTGNMMIEDSGTQQPLGAKGADGGTYRAVVVVNSTTATVYVDNVLKGTLTLTAPLNMANASGNLLWYIGSRNYNIEYNGRIHPYMFWHGDMANVQAWSRAWTVPEVAEDYGLGGGTGVIANTANLEARYQLSEPLVETKATHLAAEPLEDGLTIAFVEGTVGNSFIATDYHTFGVFDGILKDNAIAFSQKFSVYMQPVDLNMNEFLNDSLTATIPAAASGTLVEPIYWSLDTSNSTTTESRRPGQFVQSATSVNGGLCSQQGAPADVIFSFQPASDDETGTGFGITGTPSTSNGSANMTHELRFMSDGTVNIYEANVLVSTAPATYVLEDTFQLERVGSTINFYKIIAAVPTLIYTSAAPSAGTIYARVHGSSAGYGLYNCSMEYDSRPALLMDIGNSTTFTGKFDPNFVRIETETPESILINIGGVPATVIVSDTWMDNMASPAPGQVIVNGDAGILKFNVADVGATITGQVTVIYDQF